MGYVTSSEETNTCKSYVGKPLSKTGGYVRIILKIDLTQTESKGMVWIFSGSLYGTMVISFEHKDKLTDSIKDGNFPDKLLVHEQDLLSNDFVP